jgi:hypothetical protein
MIGNSDGRRKILVSEDKLLGARTLGRSIGVKGGAAIVCYLRGTRILTTEGERRIEDLKIGDAVLTLSGESKPIKWIGRQQFKKSTACWPKDFEPIRISRSAIAEEIPHRDLYVSPMHALYIDEVLIPAKHLVNGRSITPAYGAVTPPSGSLHSPSAINNKGENSGSIWCARKESGRLIEKS